MVHLDEAIRSDMTACGVNEYAYGFRQTKKISFRQSIARKKISYQGSFEVRFLGKERFDVDPI